MGHILVSFVKIPFPAVKDYEYSHLRSHKVTVICKCSTIVLLAFRLLQAGLQQINRSGVQLASRLAMLIVVPVRMLLEVIIRGVCIVSCPLWIYSTKLCNCGRGNWKIKEWETGRGRDRQRQNHARGLTVMCQSLASSPVTQQSTPRCLSSNEVYLLLSELAHSHIAKTLGCHWLITHEVLLPHIGRKMFIFLEVKMFSPKNSLYSNEGSDSTYRVAARCANEASQPHLCSTYWGLWGLVVVRLLYIAQWQSTGCTTQVSCMGLIPGDCWPFRFPLFFHLKIHYKYCLLCCHYASCMVCLLC